VVPDFHNKTRTHQAKHSFLRVKKRLHLTDMQQKYKKEIEIKTGKTGGSSL
jgi:hypothetical protein